MKKLVVFLIVSTFFGVFIAGSAFAGGTSKPADTTAHKQTPPPAPQAKAPVVAKTSSPQPAPAAAPTKAPAVAKPATPAPAKAPATTAKPAAPKATPVQAKPTVAAKPVPAPVAVVKPPKTVDQISDFSTCEPADLANIPSHYFAESGKGWSQVSASGLVNAREFVAPTNQLVRKLVYSAPFVSLDDFVTYCQSQSNFIRADWFASYPNQRLTDWAQVKRAVTTSKVGTVTTYSVVAKSYGGQNVKVVGFQSGTVYLIYFQPPVPQPVKTAQAK